MIRSAPICCTASVGIGDTTPPSTSNLLFSSNNGANAPGMAQLARIAKGRSPVSFNTTSSPLSKSQATAAKGICSSSKVLTGNSRSIKCPIGELDRSPSGDSEFERGLSNLQTLRFVFDFVLLDCPSLKTSGDAAVFAEFANTVIIVVEAERTKKEQVLNSIQTIERTKGNLLGCVLNKRQYPVPNWIYQRV